MKPQNKQIKERKVARFFENIFRNFGTIVLGAILFGGVFLGYFLIHDEVQERTIEYAAVMDISIQYNEGAKDKVSKDAFEKEIKSDEVKDAILEEISMDGSFSSFISNAQVDYNDGVFTLSYFDDDENFATAVVKKIYKAVSLSLMQKYDIESIPYVNQDNPVSFKVYTKTGGFVNSLGIKGYTLLGVVIGAVFSLIAICAFYLLDNTVKNATDVRRYFDLPVLAVIPTVREKEEER